MMAITFWSLQMDQGGKTVFSPDEEEHLLANTSWVQLKKIKPGAAKRSGAFIYIRHRRKTIVTAKSQQTEKLTWHWLTGYRNLSPQEGLLTLRTKRYPWTI